MAEHYQVIYTGELQLDTQVEDAIAAFCERFKVPEAKARKLLSSAREVVLKKSLEKPKAEKYLQVLESIGMVVRMEPMQVIPASEKLSLVPIEEERVDPDSPTVASLDPAAVQAARATKVCPKCGSDRLDNDTCLNCGIVIPKYLARQAELAAAAESTATPGADDPYAAPQAELVSEAQRGELSGPHARPFGNGWKWISQGFWHFKQNPLAWIVALVVWVVLSTLISLVPFIGSLLITLVSPVILAGLMMGAAAQEHGDDFEISHLFAGFSSSVGQLVLVGLLYLVGMVVMVVVLTMVGGGVMFGVMGGMQGAEPGAIPSAAGIGSVVLIMLLGLGLSIPLMMAYWFAPALIAMEGLSAIPAMKQSFSGCVKNILPFLLYGVIGLILFFIGAIPVGLGLLVVLPVMAASMYTAYRDIYYQ